MINKVVINKILFSLSFLLTLTSCSTDDDDSGNQINFDVPANYTFTNKDTINTVNFSGQTERIQMAEEMAIGFSSLSASSPLLGMYNNTNSPFVNTTLNNSTKSIASKVAASEDYFSSSANVAIGNILKGYISSHFSETIPNIANPASQGTAGQIGTSTIRYINAKGLEYNQAFIKSLIGALMVDQMLNNYLSPSILDAGTNVFDNNGGFPESGKPYTSMEHRWDEAYGYLYGATINPADPSVDLGTADNYLNRYLGRVENNSYYTGVADDIFNAFKIGRAAIVAKDYTQRDIQANIIRKKISEVIAIRSIHYLQQGKIAFANVDTADAFHDMSEGYGFIYSLQFTRKPGTNEPYFTAVEVDGFLDDIYSGIGFWKFVGLSNSLNLSILDNISNQIAARFGLNVNEAKD